MSPHVNISQHTTPKDHWNHNIIINIIRIISYMYATCMVYLLHLFFQKISLCEYFLTPSILLAVLLRSYHSVCSSSVNKYLPSVQSQIS